MTEGNFLLALDLSTPIGSVAIGRGGSTLASRYLLEPGAHATGIIAEIEGLLSDVGIDRGSLGGIVVGKGPGSFTGVRVAAATARGLATALRLPVWPRSSLAAAAASDGVELPIAPATSELGDASEAGAWDRKAPRYILFVARGDRLYAACYRFTTTGIETLVAPWAATVGTLLAGPIPDGALVFGEGALRHRDLLAGAGIRVLPPPVGIPTADGLLRLHALDPAAAPELAGSRWEPEYLRGSWTPIPVSASMARR